MAKSPRKTSIRGRAVVGGKNLTQINRQRRFSLVDSEDEDEDEDEDEFKVRYQDDSESDSGVSEGVKSTQYPTGDYYSDVDDDAGEIEANGSDSSLTAVSERDEDLYRAGIASVTTSRKRGAKGIPRKANVNRNSDIPIEESSEEDSSSDSDSDVDFVRLQAETKAKAMRAYKGVQSSGKNIERGANVSGKSVRSGKSMKTNRSLSKSKSGKSSLKGTQFGRRKSEVPLPDDINFSFDFGDRSSLMDSSIDDDDDESGLAHRLELALEDEEDDQDIAQHKNRMGDDEEEEEEEEDDDDDEDEDDDEEDRDGDDDDEDENDEDEDDEDEDDEDEDDEDEDNDDDVYMEHGKSKSSTKKKKAQANRNNIIDEDIGEEIQFEFPKEEPIFFDEELPVPKIRDEDINSDEDYEIDDNELLATLQAENDDFGLDDQTPRKNSMASLDEDEDPFLREEEKFLVDEFENNGFDDDDIFSQIETNANDYELADKIGNSFVNKGEEEKVMEYESDANNYDDDFESDEEDEEDYEVMDLAFEDTEGPNGNITSYKKKNKSKGLGSDDEDDSYLWNYFFSSNESSSDNDEADIFKKLQRKNRRKAVNGIGQESALVSEPEENYYDSGESTDVDTSLPPTSMKIQNRGQQKAKEVLDSQTADYRPPVLGTWVAVDSKPFGIIDGLSTRTLHHNSLNNGSKSSSRAGRGRNGGEGGSGDGRSIEEEAEDAKGGRGGQGEEDEGHVTAETMGAGGSGSGSGSLNNRNDLIPRRVNTGRSVRLATGEESGSDDSALGLDELLNVSELDNDDDSNDIKIWEDFNKKRSVPLGAFRNKSILHQNIPHMVSRTNFGKNEYRQRRRSSVDKRRKSSSNLDVQEVTNNGRRASVAKSNGAIPSKEKRRRASIIEAVTEGFRPTKSGLFSENALADVEEVLGDDHEFMALIKGI